MELGNRGQLVITLKTEDLCTKHWDEQRCDEVKSDELRVGDKNIQTSDQLSEDHMWTSLILKWKCLRQLKATIQWENKISIT